MASRRGRAAPARTRGLHADPDRPGGTLASTLAIDHARYARCRRDWPPRVVRLDDAILVGHSYGGMVTTMAATDAPDRIRALIYVDAFIPMDGQREIDLIDGAWVDEHILRPAHDLGDGWLVPIPLAPRPRCRGRPHGDRRMAQPGDASALRREPGPSEPERLTGGLVRGTPSAVTGSAWVGDRPGRRSAVQPGPSPTPREVRRRRAR